MFSYGSGLASSIFVFKIIQNVDYIKKNLNLPFRLDKRVKIDP